MPSRLQRVRKITVLSNQAGSAAIEFLTLAVVFMVPLVYLIITVMNIQLASYSAENLGRNIARAYTLNQSSNMDVILNRLLADYGYTSDQASFSVECVPSCSPGNDYVVHVTLHLGLPLIPDAFNPRRAISVGSTVTMPISKYQT
uniref:TadE/TadG family type IV pilus assembly protein n=1 Tax=Tropheryma whipplei TaxID=2039 RepID=UPI0004B4F025|nr:hypothetical protein [Tropheryma whipplei]